MSDANHFTAKDLSKYRLERAKEDLTSAENLLKLDDLRAANNRAYYSIFHALRSVLALDRFDSKKHSGIISEFRKRYIKENVFPRYVSDIIENAFIIRNKSDYDDMYLTSRKQTEKQVENAREVLGLITEYLEKAPSK